MQKTIFKRTATMLMAMIMLLSVAVFSVSAENSKPIVMSVETYSDTSDVVYKEFDNFQDGWVFIHDGNEQYNNYNVKLYADWIAPNGSFYYTNAAGKEIGTNKGRLHLDHRYEGNSFNRNVINIDLNGHKIDRNLKEPTQDGQVFFIESGTIRILDSSAEKTGMITGANNNGKGGAFYVNNGLLNTNMSGLIVEGGTITGNSATNGGGVYWNSDGLLILTGGVISGNHATENGGGLYVNDWGNIYVGGTPKIKDNTAAGSEHYNLYLADDDVELRLTRGQETNFNIHTIPDLPLSEGAEIGINVSVDDDKLTGDSSLFRAGDFAYLFSDDADYSIRPVYNETDGKPIYDIYYTGLANKNYRDPRITDVSVKDSGFVKSLAYNHVTQELCLTAVNTKQESFKMITLDKVVSYKLNSEYFHLARSNYPVNLLEEQQYRVMADNNTYSLLTVKIEPYGGAWAEEQDPYETDFAVIAYNEHEAKGFHDIGDGWAYAVKQSTGVPTTFKLYADWVAPGGRFRTKDENGEYGTENGYLDVDNENINLTIDLNGHTIDRNLESANMNGHVIYIGDGVLNITDTSKEGNGKITGGNCSTDGGAIFMDNAPLGFLGGGTLNIYGGNITGNRSGGRGGAIYSESRQNINVYGGKITNNTAKHGGAIANAYPTAVRLYGGEISGNSATQYGGALYCFSGEVNIKGATICNNTAKYGGGVCAYDEGLIYFDSGSIMNNTADYGGGVYASSTFKMSTKDAHILNNVAVYNGGGVYAEGGDAGIRIKAGTIKGNKAANGAGVYWNGGDECLLENVEVTENVASNIGGGVYVPAGKKLYVGGSVVIQNNTSSLGTDNVHLHGIDSCFSQGSNLDGCNALTSGAKIGVNAEKTKVERVIVDKAGPFDQNSVNYFTVDDTRFTLDSVAESDYNTHKISLEDKYDGEMLVEVEGGETKSFANFSKGWVYALKQSLEYPVTITLGADWVAPDGNFYCEDEDGDEYGTRYGELFLYDDYFDLTIDLNGHTIDRNLKDRIGSGGVFYLEDEDINLTIKDSAGGGKITGGNCPYNNGGGINVYNGSLYIEGGEITGNSAQKGGGIYWFSDNTLCITGGIIAGNTATENGGGIYHAGGGDFGSNSQGSVYIGGDAKIYGNTGANSENNNLYIKNDNRSIYRAAGQSANIPNAPFEEGAVIGISASNTESLISGNNSCFGERDYEHFFTDSEKYYIRPVYEESDGNHAYKLYINSKTSADARFPAVLSAKSANNELVQNLTFDAEAQVITITGYANQKSSFNSYKLSDLVDYETNADVYVMKSDFDANPDWTASPITFKLVSDNNTYSVLTVIVEWTCEQHEDLDENLVCDHCNEYTKTDFEISAYDKTFLKEATVFAPKAGRYIIVFASYDDKSLVNQEIFECDLQKGFNDVQQKAEDWGLKTGDKIMLWHDTLNCEPLCQSYTVK